MNTATNYSELQQNFKSLIEKSTPNTLAEEYVLEQFNLDKIVEGFIELYEIMDSN